MRFGLHKLMLSLASLLCLTLLAVPAVAQRAGQTPPVFAPVPLAAQQERATPSLKEAIAIIVNEDIITTSELEDRVSLSLLSASLPNTQEVRRRILPQVMRALVNEKLEQQEARRLGLHIADGEIDAALQKIAIDNKIPGGNMPAFLQQKGISPATLKDQIRSTLLWNKVVLQSLRPRIDIGEDEVDAIAERTRANAGKQEYLVSEIFLPVEDEAKEEDVKELGDRLASELKEGAVFGAVARQFSQGVGASQGGDMGWVQEGQLEEKLDDMLKTLQAGELAGPIRTRDGYHILGVREKRTIAATNAKEMTVHLRQVFHPYQTARSKEALLFEANAMRQKISSCDKIDAALSSDFSGWRSMDLGKIKLAEAPDWLAKKVADITVGHASEAMATNKGALMLFVCERDMPDVVNREAIRNALGMEKLNLLAERRLRDLRRDSVINVRLK